jgi:hypothetical protein
MIATILAGALLVSIVWVIAMISVGPIVALWKSKK